MRELACGDARAKRRLRIEIAGRHDPGEEARPARRRPATAACATGHLDVEGQHDLDTHRRAPVESTLTRKRSSRYARAARARQRPARRADRRQHRSV
jgi:hypothetical protein